MAQERGWRLAGDCTRETEGTERAAWPSCVLQLLPQACCGWCCAGSGLELQDGLYLLPASEWKLLFNVMNVVCTILFNCRFVGACQLR